MAVIDCDANATYALTPEAFQELTRLAASLGNPSSLHRGGQASRARLDEAREAVRQLVGANQKDHVIFTSGATEANNTVLNCFGIHDRVVSSMVEHASLLVPLQRRADAATLIAPAASGEVVSGGFSGWNVEGAALVTVMAANNETGAVNDIGAIVKNVRRCNPRAVIHTDAAQLIGKGRVAFADLDLDMMTVSAHKIGALAGSGALIVREGAVMKPLIEGGPQEGKLRGGTENVLGAALFGYVAQQVHNSLEERIALMRRSRDAFEAAALTRISESEVNCVECNRLPNTTSIYIPGIVADDLIVALDVVGILASSGAACSSGKPEPSHVLLAMGQPVVRVRSTLRFSFRADCSERDAVYVADALAEIVARARKCAS